MMIGSTTPLAERPDWHPVHRADALLRSALLNSAAPSEPSEEFEDWGPPGPSHAIPGLVEGPLRISYPRSLVARLNALALNEAALHVPLGSDPNRNANRPLPGIEVADLVTSGAALTHASGLQHDFAEAAWDQDDDRLDLGDADAFAADAGLYTLDPDVPPQVHVQALVREFHRRQRHVSLLVAGSLAAAFVLTLGGLVVAASLATPEPADSDNRPPTRSTSVAWQRPERDAAAPKIQLAAVTANRAAKSEPLLVPAKADESPALSGETSSSAQVILATNGRPLALAPLLPPSHARYLLLRGLPAEAALSAGQRSDSGAWFVKDAEVHDLTLSVGEAAQGDYPVEIYLLDAGNAAQGRRSLVLRVEPAPRDYAGGPNMSWASALLDVMPAPRATEKPVAPAESAVLLQRAKRLLEEGDIAAARLLLLHLAERGEGEAAYELARTFDREILAALGARGMNGDPARALGWYEQASQKGNLKAAERLKILASLSATGPSD
jgi:hypothetical protein